MPGSRVRIGRGCIAALVLLLAPGCPSPQDTGEDPHRPAGQDRDHESGGISLFVSIAPQAYFAARLGGQHVRVRVLVEAGQSPETYEPRPQQLAALAEAGLLFRIGVPFERALLPRLEQLGKRLRIVDTSEGIALIQESPGESHGTAGGDHHGEGPPPVASSGMPDPHFWLDPLRAGQMARNMARSLATIDPARQAFYKARLKGLLDDLRALDTDLERALAPLRGRTLLTYHGAFAYLCQRYGLRQLSLAAGGKEPGARRLTEVMALARRQKVRAIFVQPQFSNREAVALADELGARLVRLDPLADRYLENMRQVASAIRDALGPDGP